MTAEDIILSFIDSHLDGYIDRLLDFDLAQLQGDRFGAAKGSSFDCDDTILTRSILALVFEDAWPGLSLKSIENRTYRGDTMNSFNTLFGAPEGDSFKGLLKFDAPEDIVIRVRRFYAQYHTIGNMVVLPNRFVGRQTFNLYRGTHGIWHDYFDYFLSALQTYFAKPDDADAGLIALMEENQDSFANYQGKQGFQNMTRALMLEDYIDADGYPKQYSDGIYYWKRSLSRDDYFLAIDKYLTFCETAIRVRGLRLVTALKSELLDHGTSL